MDLFGFIQFEVWLTSSICRFIYLFIFLPNLENFSHFFDHSLFIILWSLFWDSDECCNLFIVAQVPEFLSFFSFSLIFSYCSYCVNSIDLSSSSLILSSAISILLLSSSSGLFFSLSCIFQIYNFHWVIFVAFVSLLKTSIFFICFKRICNWLLKCFNDNCFKSPFN